MYLVLIYISFFQLSTCNNELIRMSQVCKLNHLKILNLSNNNIEFMDGLKELKLLSWLGLANNKIKTIQQLNQCVHLEHLDLSGNFIQHLNDLSFLKNLKVYTILVENSIIFQILVEITWQHLPKLNWPLFLLSLEIFLKGCWSYYIVTSQHEKY